VINYVMCTDLPPRALILIRKEHAFRPSYQFTFAGFLGGVRSTFHQTPIEFDSNFFSSFSKVGSFLQFTLWTFFRVEDRIGFKFLLFSESLSLHFRN
jgi:hypothetical protein